MAKRKRKGGRRKAKIGVGQVLIGASVLAELGVGTFKNQATDNIRSEYFRMMPNIGGKDGKAVIGAVVYEFLRHEANKMHVNPAYGHFRLL